MPTREPFERHPRCPSECHLIVVGGSHPIGRTWGFAKVASRGFGFARGSHARDSGGGLAAGGGEAAAPSWKQFVPTSDADFRVRRATWAAWVLVVVYFMTWLVLRGSIFADLPANLLFCVAGEEGGSGRAMVRFEFKSPCRVHLNCVLSCA